MTPLKPSTKENALEEQRLDQWLCYARFFKTRSLAARVVKSKGIRVDGQLKTRPSALVRPGQTLTFTAGERIRIAKVIAIAPRRGPAKEAVLLYEDLSPPRPQRAIHTAHRDIGAGRPTKKDRRAITRLKDSDNA